MLKRRFGRPQPMHKRVSRKASVRHKMFAKWEKDKDVPIKRGYTLKRKCVLDTRQPSLNIISGKDKHGRYGPPCGGVIVVWGLMKNGKTTLAMNIISSAMKEDKVSGRKPMAVMYQETEGHMLSPEYMAQFDIDTKEVIDDDQKSLERCFRSASKRLDDIIALPKKDRFPLLIVLDSVSATPTEAETNPNSIGGGKARGGHAKLISEAMRNLTDKLKETESVYLIIAQAKDEVGGYGKYKSYTFMGMKPLLYHAAIAYFVRRGKPIVKKMDTGKEEIGMMVNIKVTHSKVAPPAGVAKDLELYYGRGYNKWVSLHNALKKFGISKKKGPRFNVTLNLAKNKKKVISYVGPKGIGKLPEQQRTLLEKLLYKRVSKKSVTEE